MKIHEQLQGAVIVVKPEGASDYTRYEVVGWGVDRGSPAVRVGRSFRVVEEDVNEYLRKSFYSAG